MCRAALPAMRERGWGRIVNLTSGLARRVQPGLGPYSTTKAAVLKMTQVMDAENKERGMRAFAIEPGLVRTEMSEQLRASAGDGVQASVRRMLEDMEHDPGLVAPEESAELIRLVATGEADELGGEPCSIYDPAVRARLSG
jgi:NAD(P)-dependent dehydrogenase (short-subunit alcohol dehydrogenase family)